jgi:hypothetical protein
MEESIVKNLIEVEVMIRTQLYSTIATQRGPLES